MWRRFPRSVQALIEIGILFLPGIPAYIWLWPHVKGTGWFMPVQVLVYLYFLAGCLFIGRRRWNWDQLGLMARRAPGHLGSALAFGAYHVSGQGVAALGGLLFGVIFAVIRWRAGGIVGLIIVHGLMDTVSSLMLPDMDILQLGRPMITSPLMLVAGYALILIVPIYLWKFYRADTFTWRLT